MSQQDVGDRIGQSKSNISRMEAGLRGIPPDLLDAWAQALSLRMEILIWEDDPMEDPGLRLTIGETDEDLVGLVRQIAATLPVMPAPARAALKREMALWRDGSADD